jgi:DNA adenine methylase
MRGYRIEMPILRYPGAKWSIADWIVSNMPPHEVYLEPYFGSGAVFFTKLPSRTETINDLDGNVVNLFRVIRNYPKELARLIYLTPWAREEYLSVLGPVGSLVKSEDPIEDARRFMVRMTQSHGARTSDRSGWRHNIQGLSGNKPKEWRQMPDRILHVAERLKDAQIENMPALKLIKRYRYPQVLIYCDPPYVLSTRKGRIYAEEMTDNDHIELIETLDNHPGPVLLSGYSCDLYNKRLKHWERKVCKTHAEKGKPRSEVLWINPIASRGLENLFHEEVLL